MAVDGETPVAVLWSAVQDGPALRLRGELNFFSAAALRDRLFSAVDDGIVDFDLSEVRFCAAAGIRALLAAHAVVRSAGGTTTLRCAPYLVPLLRACGVEDGDGLIIQVSRQDGPTNPPATIETTAGRTQAALGID
jgi:anti-anti-sigma regulatory factor